MHNGLNNKCTTDAQQLHTNNNDNNDNNNLFILNKEESKFILFEDGDEVSQWLKTQGINSIEEYKKLNKSTQDDLIEKYFNEF